MHTIKVLTIAFALLGLCLAIAKFTVGKPAGGALWFIPIWFVGAGINMYIGVSKAGYSVREEIPFFLLVFSIPAAIAVAVWWKTKSA